ncbi:MAG: hypothetical protein ACLFQR_11000 [Desulfovibrionales bacterium]
MHALKNAFAKLVLIPAAVLVMLSSAALAHDTEPALQCERPEVPERFISQEQADQFMNQANTYQECINQFIEAQNAAVEVHRKAGQEALNVWNSFASEVNEKTGQ